MQLIVKSEPESRTRARVRCGDLLVLLRHDRTVIPVLMIELSVRTPVQPPSQLLQELKFLYDKYNCPEVAAMTVFSNFLMHLLEFDRLPSLEVSTHMVLNPIWINVSRQFVMQRPLMTTFIQKLFGLFTDKAHAYQRSLRDSGSPAVEGDVLPLQPGEQLSEDSSLDEALQQQLDDEALQQQ